MLESSTQVHVRDRVPVLSVASAGLCETDIGRVAHASVRAAIQDALRSFDQSPGLSFTYVHYSYTMKVISATQRINNRYQPAIEKLKV